MLEAGFNVVVVSVARRPTVAGEDAAGVGVHHETLVATGVKQDGVRRFRADAVDGEQLLA